VALPDVPERQYAGTLVSHADRGAERRAKTTMIVALARKLLIALWRLVTTMYAIVRDVKCGTPLLIPF
jgi:hypothetical protein